MGTAQGVNLLRVVLYMRPGPQARTIFRGSGCQCARCAVELMLCVPRSGVANCPELGLVMIAFLILFSQFLRGVGLPKRIPVVGG